MIATSGHVAPASAARGGAFPRLPALPLVGSVPWLLRPEGFITRLSEIGERYREEGGFQTVMPVGGERLFIVNADLATEVADESRFAKVVDGPILQLRKLAGDGLFTAHNDEPNWGKANRILSPGFSNDAMGRFVPAMQTSLDSLVAHWSRSREPVDVLGDMTKLTLDTIATTGFDHALVDWTSGGLPPFLVALQRILDEALQVLSRPPQLAWMFEARAEQNTRDIAELSRVVDAVIEARKKLAPEAQRTRRDFLSLMLDAKDPKTGERLSDENIRYQILTFLVAGHETTAGLLSFALHQVARSPRLAQAIRDEAAVLDDGVSTETIQRLSLTQRTLYEALRLWPTVPILLRAPKDDVILAGVPVARGTPVSLLMTLVHRDPRVWANPGAFDPDRFLPERARERPAGAYKPFGIGRRACTGRHFALVEAQLALATLVRTFDLDDPGPLRVAPTISPKPAGFKLSLRRRVGARRA